MGKIVLIVPDFLLRFPEFCHKISTPLGIVVRVAHEYPVHC